MNVGKLLRHDLKVRQHAKIWVGVRASVRLQPVAGLRVDLVQRQAEGEQVRHITHTVIPRLYQPENVLFAFLHGRAKLDCYDSMFSKV